MVGIPTKSNYLQMFLTRFEKNHRFVWQYRSLHYLLNLHHILYVTEREVIALEWAYYCDKLDETGEEQPCFFKSMAGYSSRITLRSCLHSSTKPWFSEYIGADQKLIILVHWFFPSILDLFSKGSLCPHPHRGNGCKSTVLNIFCEWLYMCKNVTCGPSYYMAFLIHKRVCHHVCSIVPKSTLGVSLRCVCQDWGQ